MDTFTFSTFYICFYFETNILRLSFTEKTRKDAPADLDCQLHDHSCVSLNEVPGWSAHLLISWTAVFVYWLLINQPNLIKVLRIKHNHVLQFLALNH